MFKIFYKIFKLNVLIKNNFFLHGKNQYKLAKSNQFVSSRTFSWEPEVNIALISVKSDRNPVKNDFHACNDGQIGQRGRMMQFDAIFHENCKLCLISKN